MEKGESAMNKRFITVAGLFCALAGGAQAADLLEQYRQACEAPHYEALSVLTHPGDTTTPIDWDGAALPCRAFIQRLEAEPEADDLARFALYLAKEWLGGHPDEAERCAEVAEMVDRLPDNADALHEWSYCVDADERIALLKQLAKAGHPGARSSLLFKLIRRGDYFGIPAGTLARYAEEAYQNALYVSTRYRAAKAIYKIALDTGDGDAAKAIQNRLVRDRGLDSLAYAPAHRDESLERACDRWIFDMDLEGRLCVPALEALAAEALAHGEAIPDDVLRRMGEAFGESDDKAWRAGGGNDTGARLAAILAAHPEPLRSSEHLRVLAETATPGSPERLAGLRRAAEADPGNLRARCGLADALAWAGSVGEAASLYKGLMAADDAPCNAEFALGMLPGGPDGERGGKVERVYVD